MKTKSIHNQKLGAGLNRDYWAIKRWLDDSNIAMFTIAGEVGVHPSLIGKTIRGYKNSRKVLRHLLDLGCPTDILSLPSDLKDDEYADY
jgi:hypothetical protein